MLSGRQYNYDLTNHAEVLKDLPETVWFSYMGRLRANQIFQAPHLFLAGRPAGHQLWEKAKEYRGCCRKGMASKGLANQRRLKSAPPQQFWCPITFLRARHDR